MNDSPDECDDERLRVVAPKVQEMLRAQTAAFAGAVDEFLVLERWRLLSQFYEQAIEMGLEDQNPFAGQELTN